MSDFIGVNLEFQDFDRLLRKDELIEEPVPVEVFVQDKRYLGLPPLSPIQLEIVRHSTQIYKKHTLQKFMGEKEGADWYDRYTDNEVICMLGKGSGKDHCARISVAYTSYLLHCLNDPISYYGKANGVYIDLLNLAVNAQQAQRVFFEPLKNLLLSSPFFNEVGFEPRVSEIFFFSRPVRCFSGHSESEGWEGYEVLTVILDEISAFKGLGYNTPVLTPNGWVKNGDLQIGDHVIGKNGLKTEVVGIFPMGTKDVFRVHFEDGAYVDCSDDHIWNVWEYSNGRRRINKNIQLKDFKSIRLESGNNQYRYSVPVVDPVVFEKNQDLSIDPYVMGILLAEGSFHSTPRITSSDDFIINEIQKRMGSDYCLNKIGKYEYNIVYRGKGNPLKDSLKAYGLWNTNCHSKFIPEPYLYSSIEDRVNLLRGLMDGDGTPARGHGSYSTVSEKLKEDIVELCRGLGGVPTASKQRSWNNNSGEKVYHSDVWMICPRVPFNPFLMERKADKWTPHRRSFTRTIVDVEKLDYEEEMMCIKVANDDGLYVTNDYVVTHNTDSELRGELRAKGSASAIYNMSKLSVMSRFPEVGKVILLSFPRYKGDFIQQRFNSANSKNEPKTWTIKASTWEVNPTINREDLESEYIRNPIEARARFECEPPNMEDAYFRDPELVRKAFNYGENPVDEDDGSFKRWFNGTDGKTRFIHVDLSLKRDRTGLCMVHSGGFKEIKTSMGIETLPVVNVDLVHSWEAKPGAEINFSAVRQMIVDLCRKFDVAKVTFDRWQSIEMVQSLRAQGINADFHSVKKSDYDTLLTSIYDGRLRGYWDEILVEEELLKLRLFGNNKIDHPASGSKDLADALAGAVYSCVDNITSDQEIEIEIMYPTKETDFDEDMPDFGNVKRYNQDLGEFEDAYSKKEGDKWLENL